MDSIVQFLQYGSLGLLAVVLIGVYVIVDKIIKFLSDLVGAAISAQVATAEAMAEVTEALRNGNSDASAHYERTTVEHGQLMNKLHNK